MVVSDMTPCRLPDGQVAIAARAARGETADNDIRTEKAVMMTASTHGAQCPVLDTRLGDR